MKQLTALLTYSVIFTAAACVSEHKRAPTAQEVAEGEALPPAPPAPSQPAPTTSAAAPAAPVDTAGNPATSPSAVEALSEAQMARVSELVNNGEVAQAKLAQRKAKNPAVKAFADKMVKHHEQALREQAKLVKKLNVTVADSSTAANLKADGDKTLQALGESDAAGFDALYVKSQVEGHQKALNLLDTQLIPSAKTPEVVDALRKGRAVVEHHLSEARALQIK
ncbi:MAG TPA: DUF4142 domain-containing protein [Polyangiaceae bacterium]|nr:DUF4142 domain-containing protein [Polyangiaceae bacterium]